MHGNNGHEACCDSNNGGLLAANLEPNQPPLLVPVTGPGNGYKGNKQRNDGDVTLPAAKPAPISGRKVGGGSMKRSNAKDSKSGFNGAASLGRRNKGATGVAAGDNVQMGNSTLSATLPFPTTKHSTKGSTIMDNSLTLGTKHGGGGVQQSKAGRPDGEGSKPPVAEHWMLGNDWCDACSTITTGNQGNSNNSGKTSANNFNFANNNKSSHSNYNNNNNNDAAAAENKKYSGSNETEHQPAGDNNRNSESITTTKRLI